MMQLNKILLSKHALHEIKFGSCNKMFLVLNVSKKGAMLLPLRNCVMCAYKYKVRVSL